MGYFLRGGAATRNDVGRSREGKSLPILSPNNLSSLIPSATWVRVCVRVLSNLFYDPIEMGVVVFSLMRT